MRINNYAVLDHFGPFWAILGHSMSQFWQKLFSENTNASKRDMLRPIRAPVAPPENGKSFFPKTRMPQKGTVLNDNPMITLR